MGRWAYTTSLVTLLANAAQAQVRTPKPSEEVLGRTTAAVVNATTVALIAKWRGQSFEQAWTKALTVTLAHEAERHLENRLAKHVGPLPTGRIVDQIANSLLANIAGGEKLCSNITFNYLQLHTTYNCGTVTTTSDMRIATELGIHLLLGAKPDLQATVLTGVPVVTLNSNYLPLRIANKGKPVQEAPFGFVSGRVMALFPVNNREAKNAYLAAEDAMKNNPSDANKQTLRHAQNNYRSLRMTWYENLSHERRHMAQHDYILKLTAVAAKHQQSQGKATAYLRYETTLFGKPLRVAPIEVIPVGISFLLPHRSRIYERFAHNEQVRLWPAPTP